MKFLVVLCLMAVGTNAQLSKTGIVNPDGNNVQFTHDEAENILMIGPSGVITADGKNMQLDSDGFPVTSRKKREVLYEGPAGVHFVDGQKKHLGRGVYLVLMTTSGAVYSDGKNVQFRKKRSSPLIDSIKGPSGYITPTGKLYQLAPGVYVVIEGDSAALLSDGTAIQFYD